MEFQGSPPSPNSVFKNTAGEKHATLKAKLHRMAKKPPTKRQLLLSFIIIIINIIIYFFWKGTCFLDREKSNQGATALGGAFLGRFRGARQPRLEALPGGRGIVEVQGRAGKLQLRLRLRAAAGLDRGKAWRARRIFSDGGGGGGEKLGGGWGLAGGVSWRPNSLKSICIFRG